MRRPFRLRRVGAIGDPGQALLDEERVALRRGANGSSRIGRQLAARAAIHPGLSLTTLAAELYGGRSPLEAFAGSEASTDVRAVFSWSYRQLSPETARLFRLLSLHSGPDISSAAAAGLAGDSPQHVEKLIDELTNAHLLVQHQPGRYALHDLLRSYAHELSHATDNEADRAAASHRMLDHYLHSAYACGWLLEPQREPIVLRTSC